ncbi:MAG: pentapeptide repeat-containing protein [Patescibacteria group bacterium]
MLESFQQYNDCNFAGSDYNQATLEGADFTNCIFNRCTFSQSKLKKNTFESCTFNHCNFNNAQLIDTVIRGATFHTCSFIGVDFSSIPQTLPLLLSFIDCSLEYAHFSTMRIEKSLFKNCKLTEADFSEALLSESSFEFSELTRTVFHHTNLTKCDFRSAVNYSLDARQNQLKGAKFSEPEVMNLLNSFDIIIEDPPQQETEI